MTLSIDAGFDSGNIEILARHGDRIDLAIRKDRFSGFYQWFYFRLSGGRGRHVTLRIVNAGGASFPRGWENYAVRASSDRETWRTVPTRYAGGVLEFTWGGASELAWFAAFAPFTMERHEALVARAATAPGMRHRVLGHSVEGAPLDELSIGTGTKAVWLYGRQHPGEPMAEWWMEGALDWLTAARPDPARDVLLRAATIHVVPNMNPDGTRRGHLRTNAAGVNLNREWHAPSPERSPEVLCVRDAMDATGVAFAMDVHGDEAIAATFLVGFEGIPGLKGDRGALFDQYVRRLAAQTPDFQTEQGYGRTAPGKANLTISTNQLAERFGAVAMTLEMPFKDHAPRPDKGAGWSPARSKALGAACLVVLAGMIDEI